jgi:perosamine synthetase
MPTLAPNPIPWFAPQVDARERELVLAVLDSGYLNDGGVTREFERRVAELVGVRYCVGVTSGTAALALALMAAGIGPGDEVLVPDLTFIATANAVRLAGAAVKLVDVCPDRFTIDPEKAAEAIGPRTRAIIPVDVNGRAPDYDALARLAAERGLRIICDAAEALGSIWKGRPLGAFGDAGCFSFSANKTVTTGQGGMIATNDPALHDRLRELKDQGRRTQGSGGNDLHPVLGFNFKLTNLQAAVGLAQMEKLAARLEHARTRQRWYERHLAGCPSLTLVPAAAGEVLQWTDVLVEDPEPLARALDEAHIGYRRFWYPLHSQKPYADRPEAFPHATAISRRGVWLPSSFDLQEEDVRTTAAVARCCLAGQ